MFTDMNVSQDLNEKFSEYCKDINIQLGIDNYLQTFKETEKVPYTTLLFVRKKNT